jgi:protein-S-isoprenylcysteine O-methyltransferase Ste14
LTLQEQLEQSGNWLFRWRSYLPLILLGVVAVAMAEGGDLDAVSWDRPWEMGCVAVSLLGVVLRAVVVGFTPEGTSGRNTSGQVAESLNTTGLYSVLRHPLYLGNFLMWLGISLYPRLWWLVLIVVLSFWLYYERIMLAEEAFLREKFGDRFLRWAARTPAFIPALSGWCTPDRRFSMRKVLRKELSGMLGVVVTFTALEIVDDALWGRFLERDPLWEGFLGCGLLLFLTLLLLKRKTRMLQDPPTDVWRPNRT